LLVAGGLVGAGVIVGRIVERRAIEQLKGRTDPELDRLYELPSDVEHHEVPTFDGWSLHVIEKGAGRPLVLIHGITLQASIWAPQFNLMTTRYRVIAIDVRGHGKSRAGTASYGRGQAAHDVATVLEHFDLHDAVIVGHSMGGMILMEFCGNHPDVLDERVAGLVFMDTAAYQIAPAAVAPAARLLGHRMVNRLDAGRPVPQRQIGDDDLSWLMTRLAFGGRPSAAAVDQVRHMLADVPQTTSLPSGVDLLDHDARRALAATRTPSLVLVGSRDLLTPVYAARRISRFLPNSELAVLRGAGHQLMQERPAEVAEILNRFVAELPPSGEAAIGAAVG
jgi:pimeloyl-ACP methyl ester carboxylesterase